MMMITTTTTTATTTTTTATTTTSTSTTTTRGTTSRTHLISGCNFSSALNDARVSFTYEYNKFTLPKDDDIINFICDKVI